MWIGAIQDNEFAKRVLSSIEGQQAEYKTWTRMHGMLTMASEVSEANGCMAAPITRMI
jgi:tRNA (guanine26-N2/guanine27-N2)-dimethyltransferase